VQELGINNQKSYFYLRKKKYLHGAAFELDAAFGILINICMQKENKDIYKDD